MQSLLACSNESFWNSTLVERLTSPGYFEWLLLSGSIVTIVLIRTIGSTIKSIARERTRREIAAFISEGSINAEQGERLMRAGEKTVS